MANYTVELGVLLDNMKYDWGMDSYPVPDFTADNPESFRTYLNNLIKQKYYFDEICDIPDRFKLFINNWMNINMPYYCKLLQAFYDNNSIVKDSNFLEKYISEGQKTFETSGNSSSTGKNSSSSKSSGTQSGNSYNLTVGSNTPASLLNVENDIEANTYASRAEKNRGNTNNQDSAESSIDGNSEATSQESSQGTNSDKRDYTREITGTLGKTRAEQYKVFVESMQNVYNTIISGLSVCFMEVY